MTFDGIRAQLVDFVSYCTVVGEKSRIDLMAKCDRILATIHELPNTSDDLDYPDSPEKAYSETAALVSAAFPDLGFYNLPENAVANIGGSKCMVGDAIDDISDIVEEFRDVLWRFDHTSIEDAVWHLQFGYRSHWGRHMRDLQFYLERVESGD